MDSNLDKKFSYIKEDAVLSIEIGGKFYHELKRVFTAMLMQGESKEEIMARFTQVAQGKVSSLEEHAMHLFYILINEIENQAIEQGHTEDRDLTAMFPEN